MNWGRRYFCALVVRSNRTRYRGEGRGRTFNSIANERDPMPDHWWFRLLFGKDLMDGIEDDGKHQDAESIHSIASDGVEVQHVEGCIVLGSRGKEEVDE